MTKVSFRQSVFCAFKGVLKGISQERNIKIQVVIFSMLLLTALILRISKVYLITLIAACFLVIILEMFNSTIERLLDLFYPEYNKEIGELKDSLAGIVLLAFILVIIIGGIILFEPILHFILLLVKDSTFLILLFTNVVIGILIILLNLNKIR